MINIYILFFLIINIINCNITFSSNNEQYLYKNNNIKNASKSVVSVYIKKNNIINNNNLYNRFKNLYKKKYNKNIFVSVGSGVIINSKIGYIITNNHVIEKYNNNIIKIKLFDNRVFNCVIIFSDKNTDLALLKINEKFDNLNEIKLFDTDKLLIGENVFAIGNPFGLKNTITSGIISGLGRNGINKNCIEDYIQTDAAINKGNSGGALINNNGELIGINSSILSLGGGNIGIGFTIPSNIIKILINQIYLFGKLKKYNIGIFGININKYIAKKYNIDFNQGILIVNIANNSIAKYNNILKNDVIISLNDVEIKNFLDFKLKIFKSSLSRTIKIKILRNGIIIEKIIKLY